MDDEEDRGWELFTKPAEAPLSTLLVLASLFAEEALSALRNVLLDILEIPLLLLLSDIFLSNAILLEEEAESFLPNKDDLADVEPF